MQTVKHQMEIILKGVHQIISEEELERKLEQSIARNKPLKIKLGLDPSAPDIHLGHCVVLRKMKQLQDLGHEAIIVIGDFTGKIGDPTGKVKGRVPLTDEQVHQNALTYCEQIFKVLDSEKTKVVFNSQWLKSLNFQEVIELASTITVARMLERDDFNNRFTNKMPIGVHEFFYPLMQAYDSVALEADIEIGGTDQTFNILMGRQLQKSMNQEQQIALFMPILEGLDGVEKMSKSLGNYIGIDESAEVMYKKIMEIPDALIIRFFNLATDMHPREIKIIEQRLASKENPRTIKMELAAIITELYHSKEAAEQGKTFFLKAFSEKGIPENIPQIELEHEEMALKAVLDTLVEKNFVKSKSEWQRLVKQDGVKLNNEKLTSAQMDEVIKAGDVLRIGKKTFVKFVIQNKA